MSTGGSIYVSAIARVDVGAIEAAVADEMGVERSLLHAHGHRGGDAKALAIELCCRLSGLSQRRVGAHFGYGTDAGVTRQRRVLRDRLTADSSLADAVKRLQAGLLNK
jgi:DNA-binding transcriptional ArsR family regulator